MTHLRIGCTGWAINRDDNARFPDHGSHLERYAAVFPAVEINSTFYRPHRATTYRRWAASVPASFRFAVKRLRTITHERRLVDPDYDTDRLRSVARRLQAEHAQGADAWCIFDNTAQGHAEPNALDLLRLADE